jgi:hypothetical protein
MLLGVVRPLFAGNLAVLAARERETSAPKASVIRALVAAERPQALSSSCRTSARSLRLVASLSAPLLSEVLMTESADDWRLDRADSASSGMKVPSVITP